LGARRDAAFHRVNTAPGSSGSPCFNTDWELVAMHVASDREHDVKIAVQIGAIADHLRRRGLGGLLGQTLS